MRVMFDETIFTGQRVGGISRYYSTLIRHLNAETDWTARALVPLSVNDHLREVPWHQIYGVKIHRAIGRKPFCQRASHRLAPLLARALGPDVLHETYFRDDPLETRAKRVATVHDMINELLQLGEDFAAIRAATVKRSDHVICVSENTRRDLIELFGVPEEKATVIHLASEDFGALARSTPARAPVGDGRPYLLFVGRRDHYKNFKGAIRALAAARKTVGEMNLVSIAKRGFTRDELEAARECGLDTERLVYVRGDDAKLAQLYAGASALIFPSLYEGFGLPPLEAMSAGCPVICSNTSCLPEIVGDAALFFDPTDVDSMRQAIESVVTDDTLRADLIRRGDARWRQFSWTRCAKETAAVYDKVCAG